MGERHAAPSQGGLGRIELQYLGVGQLFHRARDAVIIGDARSGRVILVNEAACRLFGYTQGEAEALLIEDLVPEGLKEGHRVGLARYAASGRGPLVDSGRPIELPARRKDGSEIQVELTLTPLENVRLTGRYAMAILRDVTERRRLETARAEFIANAAHELRTPLTALAGFASTLADQRHSMSEEQLDEFYETIRRAGQRVNRLIADLLDLSQLEHGSVVLDVEPVRLAGSVKRALEVAQPPADAAVDVSVPEELEALADPWRLDQILINLLTNAYRYGGRVIRVDGREDPDGIHLAVHDDGVGIPNDLVPKLFEPFVRGEEARRIPGSGLGLAITRRLVEMMGARIWYEPGRPKGATFVLRFPRP
jgi:PAS domain S-box-containing protein